MTEAPEDHDDEGPVPTVDPELTDDDLAGREAECCKAHVNLRGEDDDDLT